MTAPEVVKSGAVRIRENVPEADPRKQFKEDPDHGPAAEAGVVEEGRVAVADQGPAAREQAVGNARALQSEVIEGRIHALRSKSPDARREVRGVVVDRFDAKRTKGFVWRPTGTDTSRWTRISCERSSWTSTDSSLRTPVYFERVAGRPHDVGRSGRAVGRLRRENAR